MRTKPPSPVELVRGLEAVIDATTGLLAEQSFEATLRSMARALSEIAERVLAALRDGHLGPNGTLTASRPRPREARTPEALFRLADDRLLRAKALGKDRVECDGRPA